MAAEEGQAPSVKLLALSPGHRLRREQLGEALWPGLGPEAASNNLHQVLYIARRALTSSGGNTPTSGYLLLREEQIVLCPEGRIWVDVEAFEDAAATARRAKDPQAYRAAIDLYAGELLPDDRYEGWVQQRRAALEELYVSLLSELASLLEEQRDFKEAIEALRRVVAGQPTREAAHANLMRVYALSGMKTEALGQYERLREALRRELDTEPDAAATRLQQEIWAGAFPHYYSEHSGSPPAGSPAEEGSPSGAGGDPEWSSGRRDNNLPLPRTSFVGRARERVVKRLLAMTRLLTLTGAGGCGKTRLALEVARDLVGAYPDGVWLVELAPLSDDELVVQTVASALGVHEHPNRPLLETLMDTLRTKRVLLVVDNCEHLLEGVARVVDALLDSCPKVRILVTGRERLRAAGEVDRVVSSLTVPFLDEPDSRRRSASPPPRQLEAYESVRLFVERARQRDPAFLLSEANAEAVSEVCRRLEGMPLAIELAAARMGVLSVGQLANRLEGSLKVLSAGVRTAEFRHRSLRATLEWSHDLLLEREGVLFGRLSVFAGGWTLEAAEEVCSGDGLQQGEVLDALSGLVEKSLVVAIVGEEAGAAPRYRLLEPIRQYAQERLRQSGDSETVGSRHAGYYLELAEREEPELAGSRPATALKRLESERDNLRTALSWAFDADESRRAELGLRLAAALGRFWEARGPGEGRRWLEKGLAKGGGAPASVRAKALHAAGFIAVYEGDPKAMGLLEESLALYREIGDRSGVASSMSSLGHAVVHVGKRERMLSLRQEAHEMLSEPLGRWESAHLLLFLGLAAGSELDHETMGARTAEALALFREVEDSWGVAMCLPILGYSRLAQGDPAGAAEMFEEGLDLQRGLGHKSAIFMGVLGLGVVAVLGGDAARGARLIGASAALREVIGLSLNSSSWRHFDFEGCIATARAALSEEAFEAAWAEGQAMSAEEAIEYALSEEEEHEPPTPDTASEQKYSSTEEPALGLTAREREVALLVARGLTNRQVARTLSISERTAANHVASILRKLGLPSRVRIAAWATERRLLEQDATR